MIDEYESPQKNFVGGEWVPADSDQTVEVVDPAQPSTILGTTPVSGAADMSRAVAAAAMAFADWKATPSASRGEHLLRAADLIESRAERLAHLMAREAGKPLKEGRAEVLRTASIFRFYGSEGWRMPGVVSPSTRPGVTLSSLREPLGVVGLITPWNFPLAIPSWKLAPALTCGNTVVIKPALNATLAAMELVRVLEEAGLPAGVLNLVAGPGDTAGDALVTDPRVKAISFTGSTSVGLGIQERAVGKKVQLEMGGKNPYLVMEDADLSDAAAKVSYGAFGYAGQKCTASSRAIVVDEVYDEFLDKLKEAAEATKLGNPLDEDVLVGPVVNEGQYDSVLEALEAARGEGRVVLKGGATGSVKDGYYISPVIVADVDNGSETAQEEIFGPVLAVIKARGFDHAVELANDTRYGHSAGIATRSLRYAYEFAERMDVAQVSVNLPTSGNEFQVPFGGNKESGVGGREQGHAALDFYSTWKTVALLPA